MRRRPRPKRSRSTPTNRLPTRPATTKSRRPRRVAITGGLGAGKSEALAAFARLGAATVSSDELVHRLYAEDAEVRAALEERFGTTDRARISEIVFADPAELAWLEQLLHPRVRAAYLAWLASVDAEVAVVEIPLLYETGAEEAFDATVVVTAPENVRRARRGGDVDKRAARLIPDAEKIARSDFSYVNDGSLQALEAFVQAVFGRLQKDA